MEDTDRMIILLDNGHGIDTPGKRSPDGRFLEYLWNRQVTEALGDMLLARGIPVSLVVPETNDIPLQTRVNRVNAVARKQAAILVSIHANAAGNGSRWMDARGWSCYTSRGSTASDVLAECMYDCFEAEFPEQVIRTDRSDGDRDFEADFYILKRTVCPAVLLENFFYDNKEECAWLMLDETKARIAQAACIAIEHYLVL